MSNQELIETSMSEYFGEILNLGGRINFINMILVKQRYQEVPHMILAL